MEAQTDSSSFQFRIPRTTRNKMDAQVAYGVGFVRSLYGWKDNFAELPMAPVSGPNSSRIDENCLNKLTSRIYSGATTPSFGLGPCIFVEPIRGAPRGSCITLESLLVAATFLLGRVLLKSSIKNSSPLDRFVRPQLESVIIHPQFFRLCSFSFLLVSLIWRQGLALVARLIK
jgi:hypothetical protein